MEQARRIDRRTEPHTMPSSPGTPRSRGVVGALCAVLALGIGIFGGCQRSVRPARPNLVLILIDTVRADHLGCYGYARSTTPNIDSLAALGTRFENAVSQSSWTLPATASILTGLYSTRHQAIDEHARLPLWRTTLAEILREEGYRTSGVISHIYLDTDYQMDQGFDDFDNSEVKNCLAVTSAGVSDAGIRWLEEKREAPFFLMLHYFDPHARYVEHPGFEFGEPYHGWVDLSDPNMGLLQNIARQRRRIGPEDLAHIVATYDSEIAFTDYHVGRVLDEICRLGLAESTLVVVAADHGEEFLEHGGFGHTRHVYEEIVHVPLIVRDPRNARLPARFRDAVELIDLLPTLLEMLGIHRDVSGIDGRSFYPALIGESPVDTVTFTEVCKRPIRDLLEEAGTSPRRAGYRNIRAVRSGRWKVLYNATGDETEVFDLASDPRESVNLVDGPAGSWPRGLRDLLFEWISKVDSTALVENTMADTLGTLDEGTAERLRALGYLQ